MNPEIFNDPQKFLWPFVHAQEAQKQLEEKLIEVEDNFAMQQAILGWIIDNPWIFLLLLNRETKRLEGNSCAEAKARVAQLENELKACVDKTECQELETKLYKAIDGIEIIYKAFIYHITIMKHYFEEYAKDNFSPNSKDSPATAAMKKGQMEAFEKQIMEGPAMILGFFNELFVLTDLADYVKIVETTKGLPSIDEAKTNEYTIFFFQETGSLQKIIGIGPRIEKVLVENGVTDFITLASKTEQDLNKLLEDNKLNASNIEMMATKAWIEQANLLIQEDGEEKWEKWKLQKLT